MTSTSAPPGSGSDLELRPLAPGDFGALARLWAREPSPDRLGLSAADEPQAIGRFLERNPGLSWGLWASGPGALGPGEPPTEDLMGAVLAGHDGRRGYLYHLVVRPDDRRRGWGRRLVQAVVDALAAEGIGKVHAYVYTQNSDARAFWRSLGFVERDELGVVSLETVSGGRMVPADGSRLGRTAVLGARPDGPAGDPAGGHAGPRAVDGPSGEDHAHA